MAKESYFNLELELNKNNLKKSWEILHQVYKQNNRPTIPDTFIINGKSNSNMSEIVEEFNNFFVNIGEQTAKNLPQPTNSFSDICSKFIYISHLRSRNIAYNNKPESQYQRRL